MEEQNLNIDPGTLKRVSEGDEQAFRIIFDRYRVKLFYFISNLVNSEATAEELVQEVFVRLWTSRTKLAEVENLDSYIFVTARNRTLDYIRSTITERNMKSEWLRRSHLEGNYTEEEVDLKQSKKLIDEAVAQLPAQQARVFRLSKEYRLKRQDIARELNISENTVRNHLSEAIKSIQAYLEQHGDKALLLLLWYIL